MSKIKGEREKEINGERMKDRTRGREEEKEKKEEREIVRGGVCNFHSIAFCIHCLSLTDIILLAAIYVVIQASFLRYSLIFLDVYESLTIYRSVNLLIC